MLLSVLKDLSRAIISRVRGLATSAASRGREPSLNVADAAAGEEACRRLVDRLPNLADAHNQLGVLFLNTSRPIEAEASFRHALLLQRGNVAAHYNLGVVLSNTGRPWEAEYAYRKSIELQPNFVEAHNNLGVVLMKAGRLAEAEASFRRALEFAPKFVDARKNLAIVTTEYGQTVQAGTMHHPAPASEMGWTEARMQLNTALGSAKSSWEIECAFRDTLAMHPDWAQAYNELGVVLAGARRFVEAERAFRRALALRPDFPDAYCNLGGVLKDMNRLAEAEAAFHQATVLNPGHEAASINIEFLRKEMNRLSSVAAAYGRPLGTGPDEVRQRYGRGRALTALGRLDEAVSSFEGALAIDSQHPASHRGLGDALVRKGRLDEAIDCYHRAILARPDFPNAMVAMAFAYETKGDMDEALRWNRAAISIDERQMAANHNIARILLGQGDQIEAKKHLDRAHCRQTIAIAHAANPRRTVLVLWTGRVGNVPVVEFIFPATVNTRIDWMIESGLDDLTEDLPEHDIVFNAMGDFDLVGDSFAPALRFADACKRPLLNPPRKVAPTARDRLPALLEGIGNIIVPPVWRFDTREVRERCPAEVMLPALIRPVDSHGGRGLELAWTPDECARCLASHAAAVYVTQFVDFRSADTWYRKYRVIFIDREPYPYHLAISQKWMVHYESADMRAHRWKLEEEEAFLRDPGGVLGADNMAALRSIADRLDLEYAGIDFAITRDGRMLVFEANPTMLVHPEAIDGPLAYKNEYVFRIQQRFEEMLNRICGQVPQSP